MGPYTCRWCGLVFVGRGTTPAETAVQRWSDHTWEHYTEWREGLDAKAGA